MVCLDIWHYWHFGLEILSGKSFLFTTGCFVSSLNSTHRYCFIYDNLGKWKSVMSDSLWPHGLQPARLSCQWNSIGQNTGVGSHSLFQGIFPTQVLNPRLSDWTQVSSIAGRFFTIWATREADDNLKCLQILVNIPWRIMLPWQRVTGREELTQIFQLSQGKELFSFEFIIMPL